MQQKTIKKSFSLSGIALHSGKSSKITFKPAEERSGITFFYKKTAVPAKIKFAQYAARQTSLNKEGVSLYLVEHVLAACYGLGIDNLIVELSASEPPALDGSAKEYVAALKKVGAKIQKAKKEVLKVKKEVKVEAGDASILALPYHGFKVDFVVDLPKIGEQIFEIEIDEKAFVREIAPARTFGDIEELDELKSQGLALGASLKNALAIGDSGYVNAARFPDEPVRHKVLDLVGDLALLGRPINGFFKCAKSGHKLNAALAKKLAER